MILLIFHSSVVREDTDNGEEIKSKTFISKLK